MRRDPAKFNYQNLPAKFPGAYYLSQWRSSKIVDFVNYFAYLYSMLQKHIAEMRAFNRFYTRIIGLLDKYVLNSNYTLPEVRILYEIYHAENIQAGEISTPSTILEKA